MHHSLTPTLCRSAQQKNNSLISQPKHILWILKERSQLDGSFEHTKHMLKIVDKKIFTILRLFFVFCFI